MATNREKYIDNASNRELAITLSVGAYVDDKNNFVLMVSDANCQERAKKKKQKLIKNLRDWDLLSNLRIYKFQAAKSMFAIAKQKEKMIVM